jgi:uncharacterized protein (TIGR02145 family)
VDKCGGKCYDKAAQFCSPADNLVYPLCDNLPYNTATHFCLSGVRTEKCDGIPYKPEQFCLNGLIQNKCGSVADGAEYNPATEACCGSNKYTIATQFCQAGTNEVKSRCGGATYISSQGCCGTATFTQATHFCDARDNKTYKHKLIGSQTWMAENLNYNASGSKCYGNSETNCNTYGRLYNWATALDIAASCNSSTLAICGETVAAKHKGVCPSGWHIPSDAEWDVLMTAVGGSSTAGTKLKAASGWNTGSGYIAGTDDYGFSALPGGYGDSGGSFGNVGDCGGWWSATKRDASDAYYLYMDNSAANVSMSYDGKTYLLSVRCAQD